MATKARRTLGTLLKIGDGNGGSEAFTTIAEVSGLKGPGLTVGTQDVTALDTGPWRQQIVTLIDGGQVTFDINFNNDPTQGFSAGLYNDMIVGNLRNFQIVLSTTVAKTLTFAAYVVGWSPDLPVDGVIKTSLTLQTTGQYGWA